MQWLRALRSEASLVLDMRKRPPHAALFDALAATAAARRRRHAGPAAHTAAAAAPRPRGGAYQAEFMRQFTELLEEEEARQDAAAALSSAAPSPPPSRVRVAPSLIPSSGSGVFAGRALKCGEVAALYPGVVYAGLEVPALESIGYDSFRAEEPLQPPSGSEYLLLRGDGVRMDASPVAGGAALAALVARCGVAASAGHLVQHPRAGTAPNVVDVSLDVPVFERHAGGLAGAGAGGHAAGGGRANARAGEAPARDGDAGEAPPFPPEAVLLPWRLVDRVPLWWAEAPPRDAARAAARNAGGGLGAGGNLGNSLGAGGGLLGGGPGAGGAARAAAAQAAADAAGILTGALPPITHGDVSDAIWRAEAADETRRACYLPAVILVATRDVAAGEELYMDYAFWGASHQAWYRDVPHATRWETYEAVLAGARAAEAEADAR